MVGADVKHAPAHSPKYHYAGAATRRLLAALPAGPDGARTLRYTNPATGGAVMPALDCYAMRLPKGQTTRPKRTTCNMICLVVSGSGRSTVGEHTFDWSQHDVFSIPHWSFASHDGEGWRREPFHRLRPVGIREPRSAARGVAISSRAEISGEGIGASVLPRRGFEVSSRPRLLCRRHHAARRIALRAGALAACPCPYPRHRERDGNSPPRRRRDPDRRRHGGRQGWRYGAALGDPARRWQADGGAAALGAGARHGAACGRSGCRRRRRNARAGPRRRGRFAGRLRAAAGRHRRPRSLAKDAQQLHESAPGNVCFRFARGDEAAVRKAFEAPPMWCGSTSSTAG